MMFWRIRDPKRRKWVVAFLFVINILVYSGVYFSYVDEITPENKICLPQTIPPPLLGNMAGVNLAFPYNSCYSPYPAIYYEGRSREWSFNKFLPGKDGQSDAFVWKRPMTGGPVFETFTPTQSSIINEFRVFVRMSDFKRIRTKQDFIDYLRSPWLYGDKNLPPAHCRWLEVMFYPDLYWEWDGSLKSMFAAHIERTDAQIGPFHQKQDLFGLKRRASDRTGGELMKCFKIVRDTYLYDDKKWETLIECTRYTGQKSGNELRCRHYFVVHKLKSIAVTSFSSMADLSRWHTIETEIKNLIISYIVPSDINK
jgi:hypothetical protein